MKDKLITASLVGLVLMFFVISVPLIFSFVLWKIPSKDFLFSTIRFSIVMWFVGFINYLIVEK